MEEAPIGAAFLTDRTGGKRAGAEELAICFAEIRDVQRADDIGSIHRQNDRSTESGSEQRMIVCFDEGHRQSRRETGDTADLPTVSQPLWSAQFVEWQVVTIAGDEIVGAVKSRKAAAEPGVSRIDLFAIT